MTDTRYLAFASIDADGWECTDTLTYNILPLSGLERGGVSLLLHTKGYQYRNIAIGITICQDTTPLYHEQRSYLLEEEEMKSNIGDCSDYVLPIDNIVFCDTLSTTITLTQQLDQPILKGIDKVGVRIGAPMHQPGEPVWRADWQ